MSHWKTRFQKMISELFSEPQSQRQAVQRKRLWRMIIMRLAVFLGLILFIVLIVSGITSCSHHRKQKAAKQAAEREAAANSGDASIGFTGCMILHQPILDSYRTEDGEYDFAEIYKYIKDYYEKPDIMVCEMEGTISDDVHGYSGHPLFKYPAVLSDNLAGAGIDLQLLATNHVYDGMAAGLQMTLDTYEDSGYAYTGIRTEKDKKRWMIMKAGPIKVGIVNYTYGTPEQFNAIKVDEEDVGLINMFKESDPTDFYSEVSKQIAAMKINGADFIIYAIHWGVEYQTEPSEEQKVIAQELCNRGVDAIIGGHPHVEQPIDVLKSEDGAHKMFCIYSVGNALSNQRKGNAMDSHHCEDGLILTLKLHKGKKGKVTFKDIVVTPTWVSRVRSDGKDDDEEGKKLYDYAVLPLDKIEELKKQTGIKGVEKNAKSSYKRTMEIVSDGLKKAKKELIKK